VFTGIITALGEVVSVSENNGGSEFVISSPGFFEECALGDSVANNGVCLTVTAKTNDQATFFAQIETMEKTNLSKWSVGDVVNLELPLRLGDRLGGHIVQGHVDDVAQIKSIEELPDGSSLVTLSIPKTLVRFIVDRGSVTLNGVSLTVASRNEESFVVALIPATLEKTTFGRASVGDEVNIEIDSIARYVEQLVSQEK